MDYKSEFKTIEAKDKQSFDKECNKLSDQGFIWIGNLVVVNTDKGLVYIQQFNRSI